MTLINLDWDTSSIYIERGHGKRRVSLTPKFFLPQKFTISHHYKHDLDLRSTDC